MFDIAAIVAAAANTGGIGKNSSLPWNIPGDMQFFKKITSTAEDGKQNAVLMGRKTWESIPKKFRPLPNRINVILSRNPERLDDVPENVIIASSLEDALKKLSDTSSSIGVDKVYIIGGASLYAQALEDNVCNRVILTQVHNHPMDYCNEGSPDGYDTFFPLYVMKDWDCKVLDDDQQWKHHGEIKYRFCEYVRPASTPTSSGDQWIDDRFGLHQDQDEKKMEEQDCGGNEEEMQYLNLIRHIIENGTSKSDRTGTGTVCSFGHTMCFCLRDGTIPLLTTKRVFWRGVAEELLWFIKGDTSAKTLQEKNIHIWDGNSSREYMESIGLSHYAEGDLGPVYGFQWRNWGAEYEGSSADYTGKGIDQLYECIEKIKNKPWDRRIIMSAWNVGDIKKMALPPCHMFCQFFVDTEQNELHCQMYQRSADMGLGVPFNIASYSLLTHLVAKVCGLKPGNFVHVLGDAHVYNNHIDALRLQLERRPRSFPKLRIEKDNCRIEDFELADLVIEGYNPHKTIKMEMAV